jgi:hypothetical protein
VNLMSNSKTDYNTFVRANLPDYITYDSVRNQYVTVNGKRFVTYKEAQWYMDYIVKFGYQISTPINPTINYAANGFSPGLVTDFANEVYATPTEVGSFSDYIQHTRSGAARMVDSDGVEKWSPHNLLLRSEDITETDGWATVGSATIDDSETVTFPDTGSNAIRVVGVGNVLSIGNIVYRFEAELWTETDVGGQVTLGCALVGADNPTTAVTLTDTPTLHTLEIDLTGISAVSWLRVYGAAEALTFKVRNLRVYRSDLGGMVDNPDTGNSYVPTDATAVFLPRRNAHVYNGTTWVNEGLLHEEAGTNLLLNTETLSTQNATVTNEPHTLSFTGTGTVTLSGTSTAGPLVGTGTGPENRVSLTFTPTAGTLTLTVSGTVSSAQLETGSIPTSWSPTIGTQATRAADTTASDSFSHDGTAMWGAIHGLETFADLGTADQILLLDWRADANNRITVSIDTDGAETGEITLTMVNGGVSATAAVDYLSPGVDQSMGIGWRVTGSDIAVSVGGGTAVVTATATGIPDLSSADATFSGNGFRALFTQGVGACGDAGIEEISA